MSTVTRRHFLSTATVAWTGLSRVSLSGAQPVPSRTVRTLAGTGKAGYTPEVMAATETPVSNPYGVVIGPDRSLYFCEVDTGLVRRMDLERPTITTIAGTGEKGYSGDGGPATQARLSAPHELRFDRDGHLFVVERDSHVVRRIDRSSGLISTVAGTGTAGFSGDGGPAMQAQLRQPHSIAFDQDGHLLVCDIGNSRIRRVDLRRGTIATFAGTGERGTTPPDASEMALDGTPLNGPRSIDVAPDGMIYLVLREGNAVFRLDAARRRMARVAGTGSTGYTGDGGPALAATFNGPKGIACAADGSLTIVDTENHVIRRVDLASGTITTLIGSGERGDGPDGDPLRCRMARPHGVCHDGPRLIVSDSENHRIRALG